MPLSMAMLLLSVDAAEAAAARLSRRRTSAAAITQSGDRSGGEGAAGGGVHWPSALVAAFAPQSELVDGGGVGAPPSSFSPISGGGGGCGEDDDDASSFVDVTGRNALLESAALPHFIASAESLVRSGILVRPSHNQPVARAEAEGRPAASAAIGVGATPTDLHRQSLMVAVNGSFGHVVRPQQSHAPSSSSSPSPSAAHSLAVGGIRKLELPLLRRRALLSVSSGAAAAAEGRQQPPPPPPEANSADSEEWGSGTRAQTAAERARLRAAQQRWRAAQTEICVAQVLKAAASEDGSVPHQQLIAEVAGRLQRQRGFVPDVPDIKAAIGLLLERGLAERAGQEEAGGVAPAAYRFVSDPFSRPIV